jgi:hypothetical protein
MYSIGVINWKGNCRFAGQRSAGISTLLQQVKWYCEKKKCSLLASAQVYYSENAVNKAGKRLIFGEI